MTSLRRFILRLCSLFRHDRVEEELAREVAAHLALLEVEYQRRGMTPDAARLAARRAFGGIEQAKDLHRDARSFAWLDDARRDVHYAARMLRRSPGFAVVAVLMMALGIGATTTLFSLAYGVLLRPLPWSDADRLVRLQETRGGRAAVIPLTISNGSYLAWEDTPSTIEGIGGWMRSRAMTMTGDGEAERVRVGGVTPSLFIVLRTRPAIGRPFASTDAAQQEPNVVILGHGLWQRRFGGLRDIVGRSTRLDGRPFTIVGVMPRGFAFPDRETQAWTPLRIIPVVNGTNLNLMIFPAIARLRPGVTIAQATTEATSRARGAPDPKQAGLALFGNSGAVAITAAGIHEVMTAEVRPAILILMVAVGLLLITAAANLAMLQLSRLASRRHEMTVRAAIGAGAWRLTRQWIGESALLGIIGGTAGLLLSALLHKALPLALPRDFPRIEDIQLDVHTAVFAGIVTLLAIVVCGLVPAMRGHHERLMETLTEHGIATEQHASSRVVRIRASIMAGQVAVACVLLIGAGLLARSFVALRGADRGYGPPRPVDRRPSDAAKVDVCSADAVPRHASRSARRGARGQSCRLR